MYILALDTSNKFQISLLKQDIIIDSISLDRSFFVREKTSMSDVVLLYISDMLKNQNLLIKDIGCIAIINGSGYFTGIRISIVVAKILKLALNIPVFSFSSSYIQYKEIQPQMQKDSLVIVALDIGKSGCVLSIYNHVGTIIEDTYIDEEDLESFFKENNIEIDNLIIVGAKQDLFKEIEYFSTSKYCSNIVVPSLKVLGLEALKSYNKGEIQDNIKPFYAKDVDMIVKKEGN